MKPLWGLLAAMMLCCTSCQRPGAAPAVENGDVMLSGADSAEFLDRMSSRATVTEAEALEGIRLVLQKEDKVSFAKAIDELQADGIVSKQWRFKADGHATKGLVAYMVYKVCNIPGGLTLTVFGPSRRYCLKELQFRGLMGEGLSYNTVTGMEFVSVLTRADEYRETGKVSRVLRADGR